MTSKSRVALKKVHCNECRRQTDHRLVKSVDGDSDSEQYDEDYYISWQTTFELLQCCGCREAVLRRTYVFSEWDEPDVRYFPPRVSRHPPN
jgi:hypothetical protein